MVEAHWSLVYGQAIARGQQIDHAGGGNGAHHRAFQAAFFGQVLQGKRDNLVRVNEYAAFVHGADAVRVAVRGQAQAAFAHADGAGKRAQVLANRFRMHAAKTGIHLVADLVDLAAGAFQQPADHAASRAVHGIHHDVLRILGDPIKVDQFAQVRVIFGNGVEARDQAFLARDVVIDQVGAAALGLVVVQVNFHLAAQFRQRRTAVSGFQLDAVVARRVVRSGDHDTADGVQVLDGVRHHRGGRVGLAQQYFKTVGGQHTRGFARVAVRKEARVKTNHH